MALFDPIRIGASGAGAADFTVDRSLRFNEPDSAHLERTPSSTSSRTTWTLSFWVKRVKLDVTQGLFCVNGSDNNTLLEIMFASGNNLIWSAQSKEYWRTSRVFRDVSAWYHIVIVCDTTNSTQADRQPLYINGVRETSFSTQNLTGSGTEFGFNRTVAHQIGRRAGGTDNFGGYMAEINFIDGQALTPSSFAETDATTGQYIPKDTSGLTFGTNGYRLKFADNSGTSATTIGKDSSGNSNNYTPSNFSVSAGAGNDSLEDTPTNNFCTLSPKLTDTRTDSSFVNGNLSATTGSGASTIGSTFAQTTGKWYGEFVCTAKSSVNMMIGVVSVNGFDGEKQNNESQNGGIGYGYINNGNNALPDGSNNSYGATWAIDDVMAIALDLDNNTVNFYKNNSAQGTISIADGYNYTMVFGHGQGGVTCTFDVNFGQRPFTYTPPSGFLAQNSSNLPDPTISKSNEHYDALLFTGTNSTQSITGLNFQPDWVWLKSRSDSHNHGIVDANRGRAAVLFPNSSSDEQTSGSSNDLVSFNSDGITVGSVQRLSSANNNGTNIVAWAWNAGGSTASNGNGGISSSVRASTTSGVSIVTYTGNGSSGATVGHGLGVAPKIVLVKRRNASDDWRMNIGLVLGSGKDGHSVKLNSTGGEADTNNLFNSTNPTSTVFTLGDSTDVNANTSTYVAYCFSEVAGFSKFDKYVGNGSSSNGTFVFTGFRPAYLLVKNISTGSTNFIIKTLKISKFNTQEQGIAANRPDAEVSSLSSFDFFANGFKVTNNGSFTNTNGDTYIYCAFADSPFKFSRAL